MNRPETIIKFKKENTSSNAEWDILIIGGGATGLGIALDASSRGLKTILLERGDFASETSSNSTKLSHGGVRYLKTLEFSKILESSKEQLVMKTIAPHLVQDVEFFLPAKNILQLLFFRLGFFIFDLLSGWVTFLGKRNSANSKLIFKREIEKKYPLINALKHKFGIKYRDCQFDDARFALNIAEKSLGSGAIVLNYFNVESLIKEEKLVKGVTATDLESGEVHSIRAKIVINATGPFSDSILKKDSPQNPKIINPLKGIHLVLPNKFIESQGALAIPETSRKRVFYVIPWFGRALIGTTETEVSLVEDDRFIKEVTQEDVQYLLEEFSKHFTSHPAESDILAVFAGVRPIVQTEINGKNGFASRDHSIFVSASGMITIAGGKWTTYRKMATDVVDQAMISGNFIKMPTRTLEFTFATLEQIDSAPNYLRHFGQYAKEVEQLEETHSNLKFYVDERLPLRWSGVYWAIHREFAVHLADVLIRRSRCLVLDANATIEIARPVAKFIAEELGKGEDWIEKEVENFEKIAANYCI